MSTLFYHTYIAALLHAMTRLDAFICGHPEYADYFKMCEYHQS